ncbi:MAG: peptidoglycan editing factor PgeF [Kordiimonadaceae bacterium]|nr:peptidoglycan editing factor PgeF [Kordiimonadaceae bacterium]MBO6569415.1 peptidoglycan editing factor PgeF [Kordiimonadaceae bacterium]MBO6964890.1 peptidoglycan editing factor PgeF [Kordiimonadaceae bacterium]
MTNHLKFPEVFSNPHAFLSKSGGVSTGLYQSLNCGTGSDDDPDLILENRRIAAEVVSARRDTSIVSCYQIHSATALEVTDDWCADRPKADAMVTSKPGIILGILTADCTPVLFEDKSAGVVGAAHAGWKGAHAGVIESTVALMEKLGASRANIAAAIGPTIAQPSYEVGLDFEAMFLKLSGDYSRFFKPGVDDEHRQFDLPAFVRHQLKASSVGTVHDCALDTYASDHHFSFRRTTHRGEPDYGRQLSGIMLRG